MLVAEDLIYINNWEKKLVSLFRKVSRWPFFKISFVIYLVNFTIAAILDSFSFLKKCLIINKVHTTCLRKTLSHTFFTKKIDEFLWVEFKKEHLGLTGSSYSRMDQIKFVKDSLYKIWGGMVRLSRADHVTPNFLKAVSHEFYLVYSWIPWPNLFLLFWNCVQLIIRQ